MRRRRIGTELAQEVWAMFPGAWQVRVMQANQPGQQFWANAIARHAGAPITAGPLRERRRALEMFSSFESQIE